MVTVRADAGVSASRQSRNGATPPQVRRNTTPSMVDHTDSPHSPECDHDDAGCIVQINDVIRGTIASFSGKWKLEILWLLGKRVHRFNALRRALPGITQHVLTSQLRELERDGMVTRTLYPEVPPRVEYALTDKARALRPIFREIFAWARMTRSTPET